MPPKKKAAPKKPTKAALSAALSQTEANVIATMSKDKEVASQPDPQDTDNALKEEPEQKVVMEKANATKKSKKTTLTTTTTTTTKIIKTIVKQEDTEAEASTEEAPAPKASTKKAPSKREAAEVEATEATTTDQDVEMKEPATPSTKSTSASGLTMAERMEKLKSLRQKMNVSKQENRADLMTEHQKTKTNPREAMKRERAREEAEKLIAKRDMEEAGEDYERSQFWNYSAESVERWNEKEEAKRIRMDGRFTDWDQVNHKKYLKQVDQLKPNLAAYNAKKQAAMHRNEDGELVVAQDSGFYRDANSVEFLSDAKPDALAVDRLAADVAKQIDARTRFSKRRAHKDDADVNYINDANQRFNQKISRFYDKHTKEIRDDFERGTAL